MICFIASSPLGLTIGLSLSNLDYPVIKNIFFSISSGTFIYIGATKIIVDEYRKEDKSYFKCLGFILGWMPMGLLRIFFVE
jgi:hypothetical protein